MQTRLSTFLLIMLFMCIAPNKLTATDKSIQYAESELPSIYAKAKSSFEKKNYDEVIRLLSGLAYDAPNNWKINVLLAKAEIEKCETLKAQGKNYTTLARKAYDTGRSLHQFSRSHIEPYYIIAKTRFLLNRPMRALGTIERALALPGDNPKYLMVKVDLYVLLADWYAKQYNREFEAIAAYEKAIKLNKGDVEFERKINKKIERLSGNIIE